VPKEAITPLPEGVDPVQVAALLNPAMSSWMALRTRTINLHKEFNVLIMGATSASGSIAISLARIFGAKKVFGVARNAAALDALDLDEKITLQDPLENTDFSALQNVDVILDYIYGPPTLRLLSSLKIEREVQYVHIGSLAASTIDLPGALLRSRNITIRGSGPGSWSLEEYEKQLPTLLDTMKGMKKQDVKIVKLEDVEKVWNEGGDRMVFVP